MGVLIIVMFVVAGLLALLALLGVAARVNLTALGLLLAVAALLIERLT